MGRDPVATLAAIEDLTVVPDDPAVVVIDEAYYDPNYPNYIAGFISQ